MCILNKLTYLLATWYGVRPVELMVSMNSVSVRVRISVTVLPSHQHLTLVFFQQRKTFKYIHIYSNIIKNIPAFSPITRTSPLSLTLL